jgi:hypothetical protein
LIGLVTRQLDKIQRELFVARQLIQSSYFLVLRVEMVDGRKPGVTRADTIVRKMDKNIFLYCVYPILRAEGQISRITRVFPHDIISGG